MNKIIIEVHIPAIDEIYDVKLPKDIQIWEATRMISDLIASTHPGLYSRDNQAMLCNYDDGQLIPVNVVVDDSGLVNGSRVLLV